MKITLLFSTLIALLSYAPTTAYNTFIQIDNARITFDAEDSMMDCETDDYGYIVSFERDFYDPVRFGEFYNFELLNITVFIGSKAEPYLHSYPILSAAAALKTNNSNEAIEMDKATIAITLEYEYSERMFLSTDGEVTISLVGGYPAASFNNVTFKQIDLEDDDNVDLMRKGKSFKLSGTLACADDN